MKKLMVWLALLATTAYSQIAVASEITAQPSQDGSVTFISIEGEIEKGDERKFRKIALECTAAIVILKSPGGAVGPALEIGQR